MQCLDTVITRLPFLQGARKCDLEGRDCIEKNYARTFNCNTTCDGVYADIHMIKNHPVKSELEQLKMDLESKDLMEKEPTRQNLRSSLTSTGSSKEALFNITNLVQYLMRQDLVSLKLVLSKSKNTFFQGMSSNQPYN